VAVVAVQEGQWVQAGEELARLESDLLQGELARAKAYLANAEGEAKLLAASPLVEEQLVAVANARLELLQAQQALEDLLESAKLAQAKARQALEKSEENLADFLVSDLQRAEAQAAIAKAEKKLDQAHRDWTILKTPPSQTAIDQAYANLLLAEQAVNATQEDIYLAKQKLQGGLGPYVPQRYVDDFKKQMRNLVQDLEIKLSHDRLKFQGSQERYQTLLEPADPVEVALAEAARAKAEAELTQARREYERVKDGPSAADIAVLEAQVAAQKRVLVELSSGPDPQELALAEARVANAAANLALAQANTIEEQLVVARANVDAARAAIAVIDAQIEKLVLVAPVDGVVLQCQLEAGEMALPGVPVITLGLLEELRLEVFVPEAQRTGLALEDVVTVQIDAFHGQSFQAKVVDIAGGTDSRPRNVKSEDGQYELVYQVVMALEDPSGKLRPGMLGDVVFEQP
jgi:multidrug resistance efflux pump